MLVGDVLKIIAGNQKVKILYQGEPIFTGYKSNVIERELIRKEIYIIYCGKDDFLEIDCK